MQEIYSNDNSSNEINLLELFQIMLKGKWIIISITTFISVAAVIYSLLMPNIYESKALLAPVDSSNSISGALRNYSGLAGLAGINLPSATDESNATKAVKKLHSLSFFEVNILPNIFLPDLMAVKSWDHKTNSVRYDEDVYIKNSNTWVRKYSYPKKQVPSAQEGVIEFKKNHLSISEDTKTGFITLSIKHKSPFIAKQWAELIVSEVNSFYRQKDKFESEKAVNFLNEQIVTANLSEVKEVVAKLLQDETQKLTLIEANQYYVFDYIDPPAVMEKKSEPKRFLICIIGAVFGSLLSIILVLTRHYFFSKESS